MNNFFLKNSPIILLIVILLFLFRSWFTFTQVLCKGDCIYFFPENLKSFFATPYFWNTSPAGSGLGFYALPTIAFSPPSILLGFFNHFFQLNFEIIEKIVWFFPFLFFSFLGALRLGKIVGLGITGIFFWILFYLTNSYIILVLDGGQIGIALAYSLLPLVFSFFLTGIEDQKLPYKLAAAVFLGILGFFDLRVSYIAYFVLFSYSIFYLLKTGFRHQILLNQISSLALILIIPFSFHLFWIIPFTLFKTTGLSTFYTEVSQVSFLSWMNLANAIYMFHPYWPQNIFGRTSLISWQFFIIPLLVFSNLLFKVKNKIVFYLVFLSLLAIFLVKGSNGPFGDFYLWLFKNLPGFYMFRDPSKFYILLSLSYGLLLGFSVDAINKKLRNLIWIKVAFLSVLFFCFLLLIKPFLLQEMKGTFKPLSVPEDYRVIKEKISQDSQFSRSIWYPNKREFTYSSPQHPVLDASLDLANRRPFDIAIGGTYDLFSYLENPFSRQLFDILGIKYVFSSDPLKKHSLSESEIKDKERLLEVLNRNPWLEKLNSTEQINSFKTDWHTDHFFVVNKTFWVVGSDTLYQILDSFSGFRLRNLGLVYLDEMENFPTVQDTDYLVFNNKEWSDLIFLLADKKNFISPARQIGDKKLPDKSWMVKNSFDFIHWRDVLARKGFGNLDFDFGGGFVFADDYPQTLNFTFDLEKEIKGDFYVRYFSNRQGGEFLVKLDEKPIKTLQTTSFRDNFVWERLDFLEIEKGKHKISLENLNGFNVLNVFTILPEEKMHDWQREVKEIINKNKTIFFYEPGEATKSGGLNFPQLGKFEILAQVPANLKTPKIEIKVQDQILTSAVKTDFNRLEWYTLGKINVQEGPNRIEISPQIQEIIFYQDDSKSFQEVLASESDFPLISYQAINPTKYRLRVENSKSPFNLIFSEAYHPLWEARTDDQTFKPLPFYSIINGFNISKTGDFEMEVEFTPQRIMLPWLGFSLASLLLITGFIIFLRK